MKRLIPLIILCLCTKISGAEELKPMNATIVLPVAYHAGNVRPRGSDPTGQRDLPEKMPDSLGAPGTISLVAVPSDVRKWFRNFRGFSLYLINRTDAVVSFSSIDSNLSILREAIDLKGQWRTIERSMAWADCGNSYYAVSLPKNEGWQFTVPEYTGTYETRMRFVMRSEPPIYSNEFVGWVNLQQFKK